MRFGIWSPTNPREGVSPAKVTPEQFARIITAEMARWRGLVAEAKIRAE